MKINVPLFCMLLIGHCREQSVPDVVTLPSTNQLQTGISPQQERQAPLCIEVRLLVSVAILHHRQRNCHGRVSRITIVIPEVQALGRLLLTLQGKVVAVALTLVQVKLVPVGVE